jgi:murein DD-endopeptidase MepM/ murein hydrolase activator NlpD
MDRFNIAEARNLLRTSRLMSGIVPARPAHFAAAAAMLASLAPRPRLLTSLAMTASLLLAGLIYANGLPYHLPHILAHADPAESAPAASAAIPPLAPAPETAPETAAADSPAALDSDSPAGATIAEDAPAPAHAEISAADIHLVPALNSNVDLGPVLGRLNLPVLAPPAEGGPYLAVAAMHATARIPEKRQAALPLVARRPAIAAPLTAYHLESRFGPRRDPFNGAMAFHAGVDLVAPFRSPVYGAAAGTVIFAGLKDAYGRCIDIDHGNGLVTRYGHLDKILVSRGQRVGAHQEIALLGNTGRSTGPHLHFEVRLNNVPQDPLKFLNARPRPAVVAVKAANADSD